MKVAACRYRNNPSLHLLNLYVLSLAIIKWWNIKASSGMSNIHLLELWEKKII